MPTQIAQMEMDQPVELIQPIQEEQQGSSGEATMDVEVEAASAPEGEAAAAAAPAAGESTQGKQDAAGQESMAQGVCGVAASRRGRVRSRGQPQGDRSQ